MESYYWQNEEPRSAYTKRNVLRLYEKAGMIQVGLIDLKHPDERKTVRVVSIDLNDLREHPEAVALFTQALKMAEEKDAPQE